MPLDRPARGSFRPKTDGPDFDVDVRIENTDMRRMNDLLRGHAKVDVTSGLSSVYSEIRVKNGPRGRPRQPM